MITKDELIAELGQLHDEKKQAIPIYTAHLKSASFLSHLKPESREEIKSMLLTLAKESEGHARIFETIIKEVKESKQDVY